MKVSRKMWVITSDWYERRGMYFGDPERSKREAIKAFRNAAGFDWPKAKREGWRCVPCIVSWQRP